MPLQTMSYWNALIVERVLALQRLEAALRHREGIVREVDLLLVLVPFVHREIDDPAEFEHVGLADAEFIADADARRAREFGGLRLLVAGEEDGVAGLEAGLGDDRLLRLGAGRNLAIGPLPASASPSPSKMT